MFSIYDFQKHQIMLPNLPSKMEGVNETTVVPPLFFSKYWTVDLVWKDFLLATKTKQLR